MNNTLIIAGVSLLIILLSNLITWLMGKKKQAALTADIEGLNAENSRLQEELRVSQENAADAAALRQQLEELEKSDKELRKEVTKLTDSLMEEVKKSAALQEASVKLAKSEVIIDGLKDDINKAQETIETLQKQVTEKDLLFKESDNTLTRIRELYN